MKTIRMTLDEDLVEEEMWTGQRLGKQNVATVE